MRDNTAVLCVTRPIVESATFGCKASFCGSQVLGTVSLMAGGVAIGVVLLDDVADGCPVVVHRASQLEAGHLCEGCGGLLGKL